MARRTDDPKEVHLVIHGHFYQPPRENPWLETIEREVGASPYSNWNERIADECYRRNGWARIFDDQGRVLDMVNNYVHLSFNFGPTLLSWMAEELPKVYQRILEADRESIQARSGHGNALAQAYGHAILPLCNDRDRLTQIRWGKRDFAFRFGREAEAMWLPETAIDAATVEDLIDEGMRFVILSPRQARRVRPLEREGNETAGEAEDVDRDEPRWTDVSSNKIDPRMPYRCFSRRDRSRYIDAFFYDGPVAHAISFEKVLHSSKQFVDKLWGAVDAGRPQQLVHAAVDGETFGHHLRHAERALSYAFATEAPDRGFRLTNYGEYLERFPPTQEVELELGANDEGTSWSCVHGIGRWCRDCSCNAGAPGGWNQAWRSPLRRAVDLVRDEAAALYEEMGGELLVDSWAARDAYVDLLVDPSPQTRERYLNLHCREGGAMARRVRVLKLLEMQRYSLLAQTSCGWFFNDISGLEAVQILEYTARTVQLYEELSGQDLERKLLEVLAEAESNIESEGTGADVYRARVLPSSVGSNRLVAQFAITDIFRDYPEEHRFYGHLVRRVERRRLGTGPVTVSVGRLQVELLRTGENSDVTYALIHFGGHDFHCAVRPFAGMQEFRRFTDHLEQIYRHATITELLRVVDSHFGETYYGLQHLLPEEREEVLDALFGHLTERFAEMYTRLYLENHRAVNALIDTGLKVPWEFRMAAEYVLTRQLNEEVQRQRGSGDPNAYSGALEVVEEAHRRGYSLDQSECARIFGEMLLESMGSLAESLTEASCARVLSRIVLAESLKIELELEDSQDLLYELVQGQVEERPWRDFEGSFVELMEKIGLSPTLLGG
jgi:alpha-amylase/alpha-mannosidase (GH57 family)